MRYIAILVMLVLGPFIFVTGQENDTLETPENVDLVKSMGTWYEIARITHWFERGLVGVNATYRMLDNGRIEMLNAGYKDTLDGKYKKAMGHSVVIDTKTNAKLKACFFWPFWSLYWILDVGTDYEYAVVGHPNRKYLWILSRQPYMDENLYAAIIQRMKEKGFDIEKIEKTPQKPISTQNSLQPEELLKN